MNQDRDVVVVLTEQEFGQLFRGEGVYYPRERVHLKMAPVDFGRIYVQLELARRESGIDV